MAQRPMVQLVCNPESGGYSPDLIEGLRAAWRQHGFDTLVSESSPRAAFALAGQASRVCIAGGDGTVRHVLADAGLRTAGKPVDIFPAGTVNLAAREWQASARPETFVAAALDRGPRIFYPAEVNGTPFLVCASIGPDARAVAAVSLPLKRHIGRLAYGVSMLATLLRWKRPKLTLHANGQATMCEAVYIAKGRFYAGPWSFAPEARLDTPLLHVVALRTARRRDFLAFMAVTLLGRSPANANILRFTTDALRVECDHAEAVQADGDIAAALPACFSVSLKPVTA